MIIYKENEIKNPLYITVLDNGATLIVYDGYAEGSDGRVYKPAVEDRGEGECEVVGWVLNSLYHKNATIKENHL